MVEEPFENKWHIEIERIKNIARKVSGEKNHFKYILFEYNIMCDWADTVNSQMIDGVKMTMILQGIGIRDCCQHAICYGRRI